VVFVAPLLTFFRCRFGLQGFPRVAAPGSNSLKMGVAAFLVLASPSERLGMAETALTASSLLGFVRSCPAADITVARPLQTAFRTNCACTPSIPSRMPSSAARYHACCKFHPRGFSPPRRFAPRDGFGCFAIRASQSSLRFQSNRPPPLGKPNQETREKNLSRSAGTLRRTFVVYRRSHLSMHPVPS